MTDAHLCPHCGHNLTAEQRIVVGPLDHDPRGWTTWKGTPLTLTPDQRIIFGSIVIEMGRPLGRGALNERVGYEGDHNVVEIHVSRIRNELEARGAPRDLIETVRGYGYRLAAELLEEAGEC